MTARLARLFSFPLLAKELTEAAARRRTYTTRVLYAVLLYGIFATMMPRWLWQTGTSPLEAMGAGRELFQQLCILQVAGIALFLPALMSGRIAQEKERDSLVLLLLTELRPWQIVLQKYAGGLVPMLTFLLLGLPLAAIAYAFGGLSPAYLFGYLYALGVGCLQIGAISLLCSAWCRTTVGAFLATYFVGAAFYAGPPLALELFREIFLPSLRAIEWLAYEPYCYLLIPTVPIEMAMNVAWGMPFDWEEFAWRAGPSLLSVPVFLGLARAVLVRRAFAPPSNFFLGLFRRIDTFMKRSNRLVGNVMILRDRENLPVEAPIYWRESTRRALGKVHYLVRILLVIEIPTIALCVLSSEFGYRGQVEELSVLAACLAGLAAIALSVQAANAIVSERVQQTLEVLLTTPLSGGEIVLQKARALRRLAWVAAIPLLTVFGTEWWLEGGFSWRPTRDGPLAYLVCAVSLVAIYLPMITWLSLWIGLRVRTRFRAIVTALGVLVLWCLLPLVFLPLVLRSQMMGWIAYAACAVLLALYLPTIAPLLRWIALRVRTRRRAIATALLALLIWASVPVIFCLAVLRPHARETVRGLWVGSVALLSPLTAGVLNENDQLYSLTARVDRRSREIYANVPPLSGGPWLAVFFNALLYLTITLLIRRHALANADRWLRR